METNIETSDPSNIRIIVSRSCKNFKELSPRKFNKSLNGSKLIWGRPTSGRIFWHPKSCQFFFCWRCLKTLLGSRDLFVQIEILVFRSENEHVNGSMFRMATVALFPSMIYWKSPHETLINLFAFFRSICLAPQKNPRNNFKRQLQD